MASDFRFALRTLAKAPGFALTAVGVLALGIGANAAIFSLVNQVLLNPAGISDPDRVVALRVSYNKLNLKNISVSAPDFADARAGRQVFEHTAVMEAGDFNYTGRDIPERLPGASVSQEFFDVFGARPALGRAFSADEDRPNANLVAILSHAAWRRLFGADPAVLGRSLELNRKLYRVVGVMGPEFRYPAGVDLWVPMGLSDPDYAAGHRFSEHLAAFARTRQGVVFERANAFLSMLSDRVRRNTAFARESDWGMFAMPFTGYVAGDNRTAMLVLMGAVAFVLLIACSNIAGLMLARVSGRAREMAVRTALGAGRWRLIRQTLAESLLLALGGALAGLALAYAAVPLLLSLAPRQAAAGMSVRMDLHVLLFTVAAALLSGVLFGLAPAWQIARMDPQGILKAGGRSGMSAGARGSARARLRSALVIAETAAALALLVGAGLFLRSLARLQTVDPGFQPRGVMAASLSLPPASYPDDPRRVAFYRTVADRLSQVPGVTSAAVVLPLPFSGMDSSASFQIAERPTGAGDPGPHGDIRRVSPGYFSALGIPLQSGRLFTGQDRAGTEPVALVDTNLARQYWPGENPIGQHICNGFAGFCNGSSGAWARIVGVVGHVYHSQLAADSGKGAYYFPMWQQPAPAAAIVVRTGASDPSRFAAAIREAVVAADPAQPVHDLRTLEAMVSGSLAPRRFVVRVLGFFAAMALLMAAVGLYGVIGYAVAQRTQEIGIRVALGARRSSILALVLGQGLRLAGAGVGIGMLVALSAGRWLRSELFGVDAFDPLTFAVTALVLLGAALLASYLPARRPMRVDPSEALRWD